MFSIAFSDLHLIPLFVCIAWNSGSCLHETCCTDVATESQQHIARISSPYYLTACASVIGCFF